MVKSYLQHKFEVEIHKDGTPILNTVFGKHSRIPKEDGNNKIELHKDGTPILNTVFGKHSVEESLDESVGSLHKQLIKDHSNYSKDDRAAINRYTHASYGINDFMHRKAIGKIRKDEKDEDHPIRKLADQLSNAVHRHKTSKSMVVYSGIGKSPEHLIKYQGGHDKGDKSGGIAKTSNFTSTSIDKECADDFSGPDNKSIYNKKHGPSVSHMLKIHIPKGHPGAYVAKHSAWPNEKEFILPPGTKMHIHHEPEYHEESHTMIWHARVLPYEK